jgi:hypothetical protein
MGKCIRVLHFSFALRFTFEPAFILFGVNFRSAYLSSVDFTQADLRSVDLTNADLTHADLTHADLTHADLTYADLRSAKGLELSQIKSAKNWHKALYSSELLESLGLLPDHNEKLLKEFEKELSEE